MRQAVIADLDLLRDEEAVTEEPLTEHAYTAARAFLSEALTDETPSPCLAPDGGGGIVAEWVGDKKNVRVVIPPRPEERAYIYHRLGDASGIDDLKAEHLRQRLSVL